jgi:hypothetical protein
MTFPSTSATIARTDAAQSFTGTQTFLSNPVLDAGTANGVLYLNGSKVVTSGSALTFDGTRLTSIAGKFGGGAASNSASLMVNNVTNTATGIQLFQEGVESWIMGMPANSAALTWAASGSEQMRLDSTGLGIGTDNPVNKFVVSNAGANGLEVNPTSGVSSGASLNGYNRSTSAFTPLTYTALAHYFQVGSSPATAATLDSSGNLGLGVTPSAWTASKVLQFQSVGTSGFVGEVGAEVMVGRNAYNASGTWRYAASNSAQIYQQASNGEHIWYTAPSWDGTGSDAISFTQAMTLDDSGNLLMGLTSTQSNNARLQVKRTDATVGASAYSIGWLQNATGYEDGLNVLVTDQVVTLAADYAGTNHGTSLVFATNSGASAFGAAERARIDSSGNLGLGVTPTTGGYGKGFQFSGDPASDLGTLWIQPINTNDHRVSLTNNAKNSGVGSWAYFASSQSATMYEQVAGQHRWTTAGTGTAGNAISFTQAMTLTANGNLLVGATALPSASVEGICFTGTTSGNFSSSGASTAAYNHLLFYNGNGIVGSISTTGSATTYSTSSDYRLKNITGPITTSGAYIDSLNPVEGTWKADGSTFVGLIAHEVQEASRTTVATGVKDGEQMQGMDYSSAEIIANLIAEVKALRTRVAKLEAK